MEDLQYIIGIGFSGADLVRAVVLSFLFAMFAKRDTNIWHFALFALLIDRTVWPIASMASSGADFPSILASVKALFTTFLDDLGIYIVRYLGLVVMINGFIAMRAGIHKMLPGKSSHAHA